MKVNRVTRELAPYPMEELAKIKAELKSKGVPVYDFGTGDPRIPTWQPIRDALREAVPETSSYPSVKGTKALHDAVAGYLERRFGLGSEVAFAPTSGSKEAVFHATLCLIGRGNGKKHVIYPDPGYPVYRTATLFAGGIPYPVRLDPGRSFRLEPWDLPKHIQKDAAAIWVNYPHNPTGATVDRAYWEKLLDWARATDTIVLSDDCYVDIYDAALDEADEDARPTIPLTVGTEGVLSFMSLSKRSGLTGYRSGIMVGDPELVHSFQMARANFGVASPEFVFSAATVAWSDDEHVAERRRIFTSRIRQAAPAFQELGLLDEPPSATFYLWTRVPEAFKGNDLKFCRALAERGVIASPSQWLSEGIKGFARFALVPEEEETAKALEIVREVVQGS